MTVKLMPSAQVISVVPDRGAPTPTAPRKKRRSTVYDADGNEVFLTLKCLKCGRMHPLKNFGLRKMADGAIRNQPWCRECRGAPSAKKKAQAEQAVAQAQAPVAPEPAPTPQPMYAGPMAVVPLTAEQVLRALAPQAPTAPPATVPSSAPADDDTEG